MSYPANIDPAIRARLAQMTQDYRPGETSAPWLNLDTSDPTFGYVAGLNQGVYGGEGSTPTFTPDGTYYAGNYDTLHGGDMAVYDASGKNTGQTQHFENDPDAWMDTAAMMAAGGFGAAFAAAAAAAAAAGAGTGLAGDATAIGYDPLFGTGAADSVATGTAGSTGALSTAFNPAVDSQAANVLIEQGAPGFEQFGGDALSGYTEAAIPSVSISNFAQAANWISSLTSGLSSGMKASDAVKLITAAIGAGNSSGSGNSGGSGGTSGGGTQTGGTQSTGTTTPFDFGPARWLPPGWREDRPMYVPGKDAVPAGWYGAGYTQG